MAINIELRGVTKIYNNNEDQILAVDDVSFNISAGEFFTIFGPSGCGKSTIINLIAGYVSPSLGEIFANSLPVHDPGPDRIVVSQDYGAFPWKTTLENVEFALKSAGIPPKARRDIALNFLDMVHISHFANFYPSQLSYGMRRRLLLARALATKPESLLMDEPFIGLDSQLRYELQEDLLRIWESAKHTMILVTHDLEEALYLSDRVLIMSPHPGHTRSIIRIPFERPRPPFLRLTDQFQAFKRDFYSYVQGKENSLPY